MTAHLATLSIDGGDPLRVVRLDGRERISEPFELSAGLPPTDPSSAADLLDAIGAPAEITWEAGGTSRALRGVVDAVQLLPEGPRVTLVPRALAVTSAVDHRVLVDMDTVAIARAVLGEHDVDLDVRVRRSLPKRPQTIQQWEPDLAFVTRLLAEEGIAWFLSADGERLVLVDEAAFDDEGLSLPVREEAEMQSEHTVFPAQVSRRIAPDELVLGEYDFARPAADLSGKASAGSRGLRLQQFPGGHPDAGAGRALATARLAEARREACSLRAVTTHPGLRPGLVLELSEAPDAQADGKWLVIEVTHAVREALGRERPYEARFTAVPAPGGYRPARPAPPHLGGVQTAVIAGPSGSEIHPDEHGRVRITHRWDHRAPGDDRGSAWARTAQPALSGGLFLPRVGWEALVAFGGPAADQPWVLGRLDNGESRPAEALPAKKVWSAWGTPTTPGGGSVNRFAMDDTAGAEGMSFVASSAFEEATANDKATAIKANDTWSVGASRTMSIGTVFEQAVDGAQTFDVGGSRDVAVGANQSVTAASEAIAIGGLRLVMTGGDLVTLCSVFFRLVTGIHTQIPIEHQSRLVRAGSLVVNAGGWTTTGGTSATVSVGGAAALAVSALKSVQAAEYAVETRAALSETYASRTTSAGGAIVYDTAGPFTLTIGGAATWTAPDITFVGDEITIETPGVTVKMTATSIQVNGPAQSSGQSTVAGNTRFFG